MTLKICAVVCCVLYLFTFMFLPFVSVDIYRYSGFVAKNGIDLLFSALGWLVVFTAIAMGICAFVLPGKAGAVVSLVGTFIPLIVFMVIRSDPTVVYKQILEAGSKTGIIVFSAGAGMILPMLFALGSAVLCFLSSLSRPTRTHSAGVTANDDIDEW